MLEFIRNQTDSWLVKLLFLFIIVTFVIALAWSGGGSRHVGEIATVGENGQIDFADYLDSLRQIQINNPEIRFNSEAELAHRQQILANIVYKKLILQKAAKLGIIGSDKEVSNALLRIDNFRDLNDKFNITIYKTVLSRSGITPELFEKQIREKIIIAKYKELISQAVLPNKELAKDLFFLNNANATPSVISYNIADFKSKVNNTDDAELLKYYDKNKINFLMPKSIKISYITISPDLLAAQQNITKEEISNYFKLNQEQFVQNNNSQTIKLNAELTKKIHGILAEQKALNNLSTVNDLIITRLIGNEDLNKIGTELNLPVTSSDFFTIESGLSNLTLTANETLDLFNLPKGDFTKTPITLTDRYIIAKKIDEKPAFYQPFAEVKAKIKNILEIQKAKTLALEAATNDLTKLQKQPDLFVSKETHLKTFSRKGIIPENFPPNILNEIFSTPVNTWIKSPVITDSKIFLVRSIELIMPTEQDWESQKDVETNKMTTILRQDFIERYMSNLFEHAKINIIDPQFVQNHTRNKQ